MAAQSKAELAQRWTTPQGQARAAAVLRAWNSAAPLDDLGFGSVGGRVDLRGFRLPPIAAAGRVQVGSVGLTELAAEPPRIIDASISQADLSGAALADVTFDGCRMVDVNWDGAELTGVGFVGCELVSATFRSARITRGVLSTGEPNRFRTPPTQSGTAFRDCLFGKARIIDAVCDFALVEDGDFSGATIKGVTFYRPVLRDCRFAATLSDVQFDGRDGVHPGPEVRPELVDVDFSGAHFVDVDFDTIAIVRPTWPAGHRYVLLRGDVDGFFRQAARMLDRIPATDRVLIDEYVERGAGQAAPGQREWIVQTDLFTDPAEHAFEQQAEEQLVRLASAAGMDVTADVHLPA